MSCPIDTGNLLFENITVDIDHLDRWGKIRAGDHQESATQGFYKDHKLDEFITILSLKTRERLALLQNAYTLAHKYATTDSFKEFLHLLSLSSVDSAFVHISHAYFQTGYSDSLLFPVEEIENFLRSTVHGKTKIYAWGNSRNKRPRNFGLRVRNINVALDVQNKALTLLELEENLYDKDAINILEKTSYNPGDVADKHHAGIDILRNSVAAFFYEQLSDVSGLPYMPHPLRTVFVAFEIATSKMGLSATSEKIIALIEQDRIHKAHKINEFYKSEVVQLRIPYFLALVLKKANSPHEIIDIALNIRESNSAQTFRKWLHETEEQVASGNYSIEKMTSEIKKIESLFNNKEFRYADDKSSTVEFGINIGPFSVSSIKIPSFSNQLVRRSHLKFLQTLVNISGLTPKLDPLIEKTFGEDISKLWSKYRTVTDKFTYPAITEKNKSYSPLAKY